MEKGLQNYNKEGFKGVTETWNIVQHEVRNLITFVEGKSLLSLLMNF